MAKYKPSNEDQMVMLPISLQDQLVEGTLEHTINRFVDKNVNLLVFDERYKNDETGAAAIHEQNHFRKALVHKSREKRNSSIGNKN